MPEHIEVMSYKTLELDVPTVVAGRLSWLTTRGTLKYRRYAKVQISTQLEYQRVIPYWLPEHLNPMYINFLLSCITLFLALYLYIQYL